MLVYSFSAPSRLACMLVGDGVGLCPLCVITILKLSTRPSIIVTRSTHEDRCNRHGSARSSRPARGSRRADPDLSGRDCPLPKLSRDLSDSDCA